MILGRVPQEQRIQAIHTEVAKLLRRERLRLDLSLNQLAKKAQLSQQMVSYVEKEMRKPTLDTLLRISTAMGIEFWALLQEASRAVSAPVTASNSEMAHHKKTELPVALRN